MSSPNNDEHEEATAEEQFGILSPLGIRKNRCGSISSQLSSPLDGCRDEDEEEASKAFWREKWEKWEGDAAAPEEGEVQGGSKKVPGELDPGELEIAQGKPQPRKKSSTAGEHDSHDAAFDGSTHAREPAAPARRTNSSFLQLTPERPASTKNASTTTEEEILDSYADSDTVSNSTILYSARAKLSLALVLHEKLHGKEISSELNGVIRAITPDLQDVRTAVEVARQQVAREGEEVGELEGRMGSLVLVAEAVEVLELVDGEKAGVLRGLLGQMREEVEREVRGEGKGRGKGKA